MLSTSAPLMVLKQKEVGGLFDEVVVGTWKLICSSWVVIVIGYSAVFDTSDNFATNITVSICIHTDFCRIESKELIGIGNFEEILGNEMGTR